MNAGSHNGTIPTRLFAKSDTYYQWADNARIISIFAVVFGHSITISVLLNTNNDPQVLFWGSLFHSFTRWSIPVFVMISGYFLLEDRPNESYSLFYYKRARKLLIPTIFWVLFYSGVLVYTGEIKTINDFFLNILSGKPYYHLWFLYMIIPLYLITPFLRKLVNNLSKTELIGLILLMFTLAGFQVLTHPNFSTLNGVFITWFLYFLPFFITGHYLLNYRKKTSWVFPLAISLCSSFIIFIGSYCLLEQFGFQYGKYFLSFLGIPTIILSLSNIILLMKMNQPIITPYITKKTAQLTFGIYLIHPIYFHIIRRLGFTEKTVFPAISIPISAIIVFLLSSITAWIISEIPYLRRII